MHCALRTARFWGIVLRNLVPVAGVFLFGWSAGLLVTFYLIETWLFLSLRMATDIAVQTELPTDAVLGPGRLVGLMLRNWLIAGPLTAILFLAFAGVFVLLFLAQWDWRPFVSGLGARDFAIGFAIVATFLIAECARYALRRYERGGKTELEDELREGSMVYRTACLVIAGPFLWFLRVSPHATEIIAGVFAVASIWLEGAPRHTTKVFGMPRAYRRILFRRPPG